MLFEQKIISKDEVTKILKGIRRLEEIDYSKAEYNEGFEDLFFMLESKLEEFLGKDIAGKIHIARSRNDIYLAEFRLALRNRAIELLDSTLNFRESLLYLINDHFDTIMPAYTHTQPAQPTTLAHYLLSYYDNVKRDYERIRRSIDTINRSPLGAAAITTTGFNISRERVCELLGFDGLVENSYDSIAGIDYILELAGGIMVFATTLSKFLKDLLDFCTAEFNVFYLSDPYVQTSSIMPQKRNPSSLEHCRPMVGRAITEAKAAFDILYNTPYGDIVDSEEELQPHIYNSIDILRKVLKIMSRVLVTLRVNKDVLFKRSHERFITSTELADTLVREKGLSFRQSHHITKKIVKYIYENNLSIEDIDESIVKEIGNEIVGRDIDIDKETIKTALDPVNFVKIRDKTGGPAPKETKRMYEKRVEVFQEDLTAHKDYCKKLKSIKDILEDNVDKYI